MLKISFIKSWQHWKHRYPGIKQVVIDLSPASYVDVAGSKMLVQLAGMLTEKGISLKLADVLSGVRDILRKQNMEEVIGHIRRYSNLPEVVNEFEQQSNKLT